MEALQNQHVQLHFKQESLILSSMKVTVGRNDSILTGRPLQIPVQIQTSLTGLDWEAPDRFSLGV